MNISIIKIKIVAIILFFVFFIWSIVFATGYMIYPQTFKKLFVKTAVNEAYALSEQSQELIITNDLIRLKNLVNEIKKHQGYIVYAFITDVENKVLTHTFKAGLPENLANINKVNRRQEYHVNIVKIYNVDVYDISVPIVYRRNQIGTIHLGIIENIVLDMIKTSVKIFVPIVLITIIIALISGFWFADQIIKPVKMLKKANEKNEKNEKKIKNQFEELQASSEELRQNIEELQVINENSAKQKKRLNILNKEVTKSEKKLKDILDAFVDSVYINTPDYNIDYQNKSMEKLTNGNKIGEKCYKAIYNRDDVCEWCIYEKLKTEKKITYEFKDEDRNKYYIKSNILLEGDAKMTVFYDVTKQKISEQILRKNNAKIEKAHKNITDSLNYAKTIQEALLTGKELIDTYLGSYFLLFKPKEQVSGDFYYVNKIDKYIIFVVADCTGHGVPGGFLTMIGITYLHETIRHKYTNTPGSILDILRNRIKRTFRTFGSENQNGFDIALCIIDTKTNIMQYAGANNSLWIIREEKLIEHRATRNPIGFYRREVPFKTNDIQLKTNDLIYLFSDGFQDQLGGDRKRTFSKRRFRELILKISSLPVSEQKDELEKTFISWKKHYPQIDDITIMGVKITDK